MSKELTSTNKDGGDTGLSGVAGSGAVLVKKQRCTRCGGKGWTRYPNGATSQCPTCTGTGWMDPRTGWSLPHPNTKLSHGGSAPLAGAAGYALIGRCDTCGNINAVDLDGTPEHEREMQAEGRTVERVTETDALRLWKLSARCDHKKLVAQLREELSKHNTADVGRAGTKPTKPNQP